jgi:hypothetical protein
MIKWLNKQGVESSKGFVLQSIHRFYYHYIEGDKKMQVFVEPFTEKSGKYFETIALKSLNQWLPPHADVPIDDKERDQIKENISEALRFMGIDHQFTEELR